MSVQDGVIRLPQPTTTGAVAQLSTTDIQRGDNHINLAVTGTATAANGNVSTTRGTIEEIAQPIPHGVEQSWCFRTPPAGKGDPTVRVQVTVTTRNGSAPLYPERNAQAHGVTLRSPNLLTAVYEDGILIDTAGHREPVTARYINDHIELTIPVDVLTHTTFPATLDPGFPVTPG